MVALIKKPEFEFLAFEKPQQLVTYVVEGILKNTQQIPSTLAFREKLEGLKNGKAAEFIDERDPYLSVFKQIKDFPEVSQYPELQEFLEEQVTLRSERLTLCKAIEPYRHSAYGAQPPIDEKADRVRELSHEIGDKFGMKPLGKDERIPYGRSGAFYG